MANEAFAGPPKRLGTSTGPGLYDPRPSEEQEPVWDSMRRFGEEVLRNAARAADDAAGATDAVLAQIQALGLAALSVPEALGGAAAERSTVTGALVAEELARGDMGSPSQRSRPSPWSTPSSSGYGGAAGAPAARVPGRHVLHAACSRSSSRSPSPT